MGFRLSSRSRDLWKLLSLLFDENDEFGVLLRFESLFEDELLLLRLWPMWWLLGVDGDEALCCLMLVLLLLLFSIGDGDCDGSGGNGGIGKPGNLEI